MRPKSSERRSTAVKGGDQICRSTEKRVRNEMDLVPARGQFHSQFGGDNPAAAVGWITSDADVHLASVAKPICPCRFSSGNATSPPPNHTRIRPPSTTTVGSQITLEF